MFNKFLIYLFKGWREESIKSSLESASRTVSKVEMELTASLAVLRDLGTGYSRLRWEIRSIANIWRKKNIFIISVIITYVYQAVLFYCTNSKFKIFIKKDANKNTCFSKLGWDSNSGAKSKQMCIEGTPFIVTCSSSVG